MTIFSLLLKYMKTSIALRLFVSAAFILGNASAAVAGKAKCHPVKNNTAREWAKYATNECVVSKTTPKNKICLKGKGVYIDGFCYHITPSNNYDSTWRSYVREFKKWAQNIAEKNEGKAIEWAATGAAFAIVGGENKKFDVIPPDCDQILDNPCCASNRPKEMRSSNGKLFYCIAGKRVNVANGIIGQSNPKTGTIFGEKSKDVVFPLWTKSEHKGTEKVVCFSNGNKNNCYYKGLPMEQSYMRSVPGLCFGPSLMQAETSIFKQYKFCRKKKEDPDAFIKRLIANEGKACGQNVGYEPNYVWTDAAFGSEDSGVKGFYTGMSEVCEKQKGKKRKMKGVNVASCGLAHVGNFFANVVSAIPSSSANCGGCKCVDYEKGRCKKTDCKKACVDFACQTVGAFFNMYKPLPSNKLLGASASVIGGCTAFMGMQTGSNGPSANSTVYTAYRTLLGKGSFNDFIYAVTTDAGSAMAGCVAGKKVTAKLVNSCIDKTFKKIAKN